MAPCWKSRKVSVLDRTVRCPIEQSVAPYPRQKGLLSSPRHAHFCPRAPWDRIAAGGSLGSAGTDAAGGIILVEVTRAPGQVLARWKMQALWPVQPTPGPTPHPRVL